MGEEEGGEGERGRDGRKGMKGWDRRTSEMGRRIKGGWEGSGRRGRGVDMRSEIIQVGGKLWRRCSSQEFYIHTYLSRSHHQAQHVTT